MGESFAWPLALIWLLEATTLLSGVIIGIHDSFRQILGYSLGNLELRPKIQFILKTEVIGASLILLASELFSLPYRGAGRIIFIILGSIVFSIILSVVHTKIVKRKQKITLINSVVVGVTVGGVALWLGEVIDVIHASFSTWVAGIIFGACGGFIAHKMLSKKSKKPLVVGDIKEITGGILLGGISGALVVGIVTFMILGEIIKEELSGEDFIIGGILYIIGVIVVMIFAGVAGGIVSAIAVLVRLIAMMIGQAMFFAMSPLLILSRFKTILCNNCLRYTQPLKSRYETGKRYCEHCHEEVEHTNDRGKLIFTFGNIPLNQDGRRFLLFNPDFEQKERSVDVSEVYIDTKTSDIRLLERFITYIINYPPRHGLRSVEIFYRGKLVELGDNLKNALRNNFKHIERIEV